MRVFNQQISRDNVYNSYWRLVPLKLRNKEQEFLLLPFEFAVIQSKRNLVEIKKIFTQSERLRMKIA